MAFWSDDRTPEPLRSHRWFIRFTKGGMEKFTYALKECKKPEYEVTVTEHRRLNHYIKLPGLVKWKPITVKFASVRDTSDLASKTILDRLLTGGYTIPADGDFLNSAVSKDKMIEAVGNDLEIIQLDPDGKEIEIWKLHNPLITSTNFGSLSYESEDIVNIECTINYDWATLNSKDIVQDVNEVSTLIASGSIKGYGDKPEDTNIKFDGTDSTKLIKNEFSDPKKKSNISTKINVPIENKSNKLKRRFTQRDLENRDIFTTLLNFNDFLVRSQQEILAAKEAEEIRRASITDEQRLFQAEAEERIRELEEGLAQRTALERERAAAALKKEQDAQQATRAEADRQQKEREIAERERLKNEQVILDAEAEAARQDAARRNAQALLDEQNRNAAQQQQKKDEQLNKTLTENANRVFGSLPDQED